MPKKAVASSPSTKKQKKVDVIYTHKNSSYTCTEIAAVNKIMIIEIANKQCNYKFFVDKANRRVIYGQEKVYYCIFYIYLNL